MTEIEKIIEWVRVNGIINAEDKSLINAHYKDFRLRIFPIGEWSDGSDPPWAGVIKKGGDWTKAKSFYKFNTFLEYVQSD